jgi:hypothetical protein
MTVIAMSHEMASLGRDVALGVAEKLGIERHWKRRWTQMQRR